jgi:hypothetical protein
LLESRWQSIELRMAEFFPCASSDRGGHIFRCSGLQYCQAPGASWVVCEHSETAPPQTAKGPARRTDGVATEKSTPPSKDPLDPHPLEKWGRSRAQDVDWICSSDLHFHPRASSNSEPMRAVSSQLCIRRSKRIRSWRKATRV